MKIIVETNVHAPIEKVWEAYTVPDAIVRWNAASDDWHTTRAIVDLRVGGEFLFRMEAKDGSAGFDFAGTYTEMIPYRVIEYSFGDRMARVEFTQTGTDVHVAVSFDAEPTHSPEEQKAGWQAILDNFARYAEGRK